MCLKPATGVSDDESCRKKARHAHTWPIFKYSVTVSNGNGNRLQQGCPDQVLGGQEEILAGITAHADWVRTPPIEKA